MSGLRLVGRRVLAVCLAMAVLFIASPGVAQETAIPARPFVAAPSPHPIARTSQPMQIGVLFCDGQRVGRDIDGNSRGRSNMRQDRERDASGTGAYLAECRKRGLTEKPYRPFNKYLGLRPRNKNGGRDDKFHPIKLLTAEYVLQRLAGGAASRRPSERLENGVVDLGLWVCEQL